VGAFLPRDAVRHTKPHPEHLGRCVELLGVHASRVLMVGDHPMDIRTGRQAGTATAGVLTGNSTASALREEGADHVLEDATQVLTLLPDR